MARCGCRPNGQPTSTSYGASHEKKDRFLLVLLNKNEGEDIRSVHESKRRVTDDSGMTLNNNSWNERIQWHKGVGWIRTV